jgi:polyisoprenoid-binding protein YceI
MGHGEVAGFEASVVLNRKDFGIDIGMPRPSGGAVVGRIAKINARLTLRELIDPVDLRHDRGCR